MSIERFSSFPAKTGASELPAERATEITPPAADRSSKRSRKEGITNSEIAALFHAARESDYAELLVDIKQIGQELRSASKEGGAWASGMIGRVSRLRQRLTEIQTIDFFPAAGGKQAEALLSETEARLRRAPLRKVHQQTGAYSGRGSRARESTSIASRRPG